MLDSIAKPSPFLEDRWDDSHAATLTPEELLLYRSNLLGADKRITNFGGGNTSAKLTETDPLTGEKVEVLWVKGRAATRLDEARRLLDALHGQARGAEDALPRASSTKTSMVGYLPHCTFNLNPRAASIDTPLHGFMPCATSITCIPTRSSRLPPRKNSKALTRRSSATRSAGCPGSRPGFELGLMARSDSPRQPAGRRASCSKATACSPGARLPRRCYETTLDIINKAIAWLAEQDRRQADLRRRGVASRSTPDERRAIAARTDAATSAGCIGEGRAQGRPFRRSARPCSNSSIRKDSRALAALGTSCPDHFLRTKIRPLVLDFDPAKPDVDDVAARLEPALEDYRADYAAYYERCKHADSPAMRDPNPVVYLVPGVGMITFAARQGDGAHRRPSSTSTPST